MIALLLALAPVTYGHTVYGTITPPSHMVDCIGIDAALFARECPSQHCEHTDCRDELARAWSVHCYGIIECTDEVDAYCKWHSDGTVEAKNATCTRRREGTTPSQ